MLYILWSGGFDSTYLLCKRMREYNGVIQPVYLDFSRTNTETERKQRFKLLDLIKSKEGMVGTLMYPLEINLNTLPRWDEYDEAYKKWEGRIGTQYSHLGKLAKIFPVCEIGIEAPAPGYRENDIGKMLKTIMDAGLKMDEEGNIDPNEGDKDLRILLGGFRFPIIKINELTMTEEMKAWGCEDVMLETRTCTSALARNCGVCPNCEVKWRYGDKMAFLFDERAKKDHAIKLYLAEKYGDAYAGMWHTYVWQGDWITVRNEDGQVDDKKTEKLNQYFSYLENNWPKVEVNAPTL